MFTVSLSLSLCVCERERERERYRQTVRSTNADYIGLIRRVHAPAGGGSRCFTMPRVARCRSRPATTTRSVRHTLTLTAVVDIPTCRPYARRTESRTL